MHFFHKFRSIMQLFLSKCYQFNTFNFTGTKILFTSQLLDTQYQSYGTKKH